MSSVYRIVAIECSGCRMDGMLTQRNIPEFALHETQWVSEDEAVVILLEPYDGSRWWDGWRTT